jgi:hypothetical protein
VTKLGTGDGIRAFDGTFFTKKADGSRVLPSKKEDSNFHIEGELVVCGPDTQSDHLEAMRPIFDAIGRRPGLVVSPMPRYVSSGCCADVLHVSNRLDRNFRMNIQQQLDNFTKKIKNHLFNDNRRSMRVLDSLYSIRNLEDNDIWFVDPVHPINRVYRLVAAGIIKVAATLKEADQRQDAKRRRTDSWDNPQPNRKPREASHSRSGEHTSFPRDGQSGGHQSYRGARGGRGGRSFSNPGGHRY